MFDLIIVGGGPAGLSASVYAARKRLNALLISHNIGGQPNTTGTIENYLGYQFIEGPELVDRFYAQVNQFPIEQKIGEMVTRLDNEDNVFTVLTESGAEYEARTVVFATGKKPRKLNVPGEDKYMGRGVSYCAVCDGPVFAGKKVAVLGGGNSALEAALDMVKIAEHVYLISLEDITGDALLSERLGEARNATVFIRHSAEAIEGGEFVERLIIEDMPSGERRTIEVSGIFVEIGLTPNSEALSHLVKLNKLGEVPISCYCETTLPGLYAAGDVTDVPEKQIIVAAGEGAKAALQAHRYLQHLELD